MSTYNFSKYSELLKSIISYFMISKNT